MKILAIGDFHGKFPAKLKKEAKNVDLILCTGDFANADKIRNLIFKNWAGKKWFEVVGLKKAKQLQKESFNSGLKILRELNQLKKRIYSVWGNVDFYEKEKKELYVGNYVDKVKILKNISVVDGKKRKEKNIWILGHGGYVDVTEFIKNPIDSDKKKQKARLKRYNKDKEKLFKLFKIIKHKKGFIFITHYTPYGFFDKVKFKGSPMNGKNVGWEPYNQVIKKYKPCLVVCGHMHENQGKKKLRETWIVNPGPAQNGKAAIIEFDEKNKKVKNIRFLK